MRTSGFARLEPPALLPFLNFLIVFSLIITVSTRPADQRLTAAQLNLQEQELNITSNSAALRSGNIRVKFEWAQEKIDKIHFVALLCAGDYVGQDPGEQIAAPQICYQPKFGKVAIQVDGVPRQGQTQSLLREYLVIGIQKGHEHIVQSRAQYKLIVRLYDDEGFKGSVTFMQYKPPKGAINPLDDGTTLTTSPLEWQSIESNMVDLRAGYWADAPLIVMSQPEDAQNITVPARNASPRNEISYNYDLKNTGEGLTLQAYTVGALDVFVAFSHRNAPTRDIGHVLQLIFISAFQFHKEFSNLFSATTRVY